MLQGHGGDQVGAAGQDTAGLRTADRLTTGEDDQIGALGDEATQVRAGRQLSRGVDDNRHAAGVGDPQTSGKETVPGVSRIGQATDAVRSVMATSICQG